MVVVMVSVMVLVMVMVMVVVVVVKRWCRSLVGDGSRQQNT